jgi:hypothetical protein
MGLFALIHTVTTALNHRLIQSINYLWLWLSLTRPYLISLTVFKYTGNLFGKLFFPLHDFIRMDFILADDLSDGLVSPESFQGDFGLEGWTVFAAAGFQFVAPYSFSYFRSSFPP